ncbi:MAG: DUF3179 domain-containing (seleno)protein [Gammaproteobacteria bacterium]
MILERDEAILSHVAPFSADKTWAPPKRAVEMLFQSADSPPVVSADQAEHQMRDDDIVGGVIHKGVTRAYPLWVIDYYHCVNDLFEGDRVCVASCERCGTVGAWMATIEERQPLTFHVYGVYNCVLLQRDLETNSLWLHHSGLCLEGTHQGRLLPQLVTWYTTWRRWREWHPGTQVVLPPANPMHRVTQGQCRLK